MKNAFTKCAAILTVLMGIGGAQAQDGASSISDVSVKGHWIQVFDQNGKKACEMSAAGKEIQGIAGDFFVVLSTHWLQTYDAECKKIREMPATGKAFRGAAGTRFTVQSGVWIQTYDRNCKKISERHAN